jgi:DNA-directed DNA polymerase III PolC
MPESPVIGIADNANTFGHIKHYNNCKVNKIKPILGVRLMVCDAPIEKVKVFGPIYVFLAKNKEGLSEIYRLVSLAYEQYYYHPRLFQYDLSTVSSNVIVIANSFNSDNRIDYIALDQTTPAAIANWIGIPKVAMCLNWYPTTDDKIVYQLHAGSRLLESQTFPQHILSDDEWLQLYPGRIQALMNTHKIAMSCESYEIPSAPMVKYKGNGTLEDLCVLGAIHRNIDLKESPYKERYEHELTQIKHRGFEDYFLIVAEMIRTAKKKMFVGPSRGSSAGSLVCYLIQITELDPIKFGLLFERFIDVNRTDLPDIDVDFPDTKRKIVINALTKIYGEKHVSRIATISTMQPRIAINEFAVGLCVPAYETDAVKDEIIERSVADVRADKRIEDTFQTVDSGIEFINKYPEMKVTAQIEGHARHSGVHAAGVIVSNEPLTNYGSVNARDSALMMDHKDAESLNLLKIDCLGLRTLAILESVAEQINMPYKGYYDIPLDDEKTFSIFNSLRLTGIFQFQGSALQFLTRQMGVQSFDDICAITALARPGPMHSGGATMFVERKTGVKKVKYLANHPVIIEHTKSTYGVIIYQEQLMSIAHEYGRLNWEEVNDLRKSASKSFGEEYLGKFKEKFVAGAIENGSEDYEAKIVWDSIVTFGAYGFNKSHAYSYGLISYFTAWAKAHHPQEFAVANLNHASGNDQAVRILRDLVRHDGLEYTAFDPDLSVEQWSVQDGELLGGLLSLEGIGPKKAKAIIAARKNPKLFTPSLVKAIMEPNTPFNILFPCENWWGEIFSDPEKFGLVNSPVFIEEISETDEYLFIGKLLEKNLRDLNEPQSLARRNGQYITDHRLYLSLKFEDDTDEISATINRYNFESMGREILEYGRVDHDWYLIKGMIRDTWRRIDVTQILNLNTWGQEYNLGPDV